MAHLITGLLIVVGLINFAPVIGLLSADRLTRLYGVAVADPNMQILLQHRALLFGLVGGVIIASAFLPYLRPTAFILGFISMIGFILIAWQAGEFNALLKKVVIADAVGIGLLAVALFLSLMATTRQVD